ncbi:MAG: hypothetical protein BAJATHORv1_20080 [Candidatus Thorarchaeota archaeon]|nr:MAG: hypothetical protein BAJATHORv1_20080 [Candidatus Thorarchaeota archaeon]
MNAKLVEPDLWREISQIIDRDFGQDITRKISIGFAPFEIPRGKNIAMYLVPMSWIDLMDNWNAFSIQSMGLWLGDYDGTDFKISLLAAQKIAEDTSAYIIISSHSAEAFTYGRSILKESVIELNEQLTRGQKVIVFNEEHECLGIALLSIDANKLNRLGPDKLVAKNLVDIGWYIRRLG